jgi:hypothetical protein
MEKINPKIATIYLQNFYHDQPSSPKEEMLG